jgi:hypothetical protein
MQQFIRVIFGIRSKCDIDSYKERETHELVNIVAMQDLQRFFE